MEEALRIAYLPVEQQRAHQWLELKKMLCYVSEHSLFYQELFLKHHVDLEEINSLEDFLKIPFTEKEDVAKREKDFYCVEPNQIADYCATTGTLGHPVTIPLSNADIDRLASNEAFSFQLMELSSEDTVQLLLTLDRQFMAGLAYYQGLRKLNIPCIRTGPLLPAMQLDIAKNLKSTVWVAVPSFILKIIAYAEQIGFNLNELSVKKILCIGENIRDEHLEPNALAKKITAHWNVQLFSTYASTEMQTAFTECKHGCSTHQNLNLIYVEIIDELGNPVLNDTYGEVVVTPLGIEAMPLLRYKTGDIAKLITETCNCGISSSRLSPIMGRKKQMIKYKGTTIYPASLYNLLHNFEGVLDYVLEVKHDEFLQDQLTLFIHTKTKSQTLENEIKGYLKLHIRLVPEVIFLEEIEMQELLFAAGTRKAQKFIDLRKENGI
jgi:phenylacetate-CoA ligase